MAGGAAQAPLEELRLALVLNGGVSLAVWMGGATRELDLLVRAWDHRGSRPALDEDNPYAALLSSTRTTATVDVVAGTSAGGINGAALSLSLANVNADLGALRDLWAEQGDLAELLRPPFQGEPNSLLRGDDFFLPALTRAMRGLTADFEPTYANIDLTMTTTLLTGAVCLTTDDLGQVIPQNRHGASLRFSTEGPDGTSDFDRDRVAETARAMALAARSTAGFPVAFEPAYLPVDEPRTASGDGGAPGAGGRRPDLGRWASWSDRNQSPVGRAPEPGNRSRFAIDGGVLANTPTRMALAAIDQQKALGPMRRQMLLVYPHAPVVDEAQPAGPHAEQDQPPSVTDTLSGLLGALSSQGSLTFVDEIERHNREALRWRGGRRHVVETTPDPASVYELLRHAWPHYQRARVRVAARTLADRAPRPDTWTYARIAREVERAHEAWCEEHGGLPYVPSEPPPALPPATTTWAWGPNVSLDVADTVMSLVIPALGVATAGETPALMSAAQQVSDARAAAVAARDEFDRIWWSEPGAADAVPDHHYWRLRMLAYRRALLGAEPGDDDELKRLVARCGLPPAAASGIASVVGGCGRAVAAATATMVAQLEAVLPTLRSIDADPARGALAELTPWLDYLDAPHVAAEQGLGTTERLTSRLLALDAATWLVADAEAPGTSQAIKLAQLTLDIDHGFTKATVTRDDKVAGTELHRFGGFLKQSWRVNDWIWGRLDGAQMLCRLLLDPDRLRRMHVLSGQSPEVFAGDLVRGLKQCAATCACTSSPGACAGAEHEEVLELLRGGESHDGYLPRLARLAALPVQHRIILEELPALRAAVEADIAAGRSAGPRGRTFLDRSARLSARIEDAGREPWRTLPPETVVELGAQALDVFDRAGIGREPVEEEARSDGMIQTTVNAAAGLVTLLDSDRLGVKALKPVSRAVRGAALVPYWLITGLTTGGTAARSLALLGFATGGVLLALSLLGVLGGLSSVGSTVGIGVLLGALGYAALRSGTLLHGVVLLGPVVPLLAYAFDAPLEQPGDGATATAAVQSAAEAARAGVSVVAVLALAAGLVALASLPHPLRSPLATLLGRSRRALVLTLVALVLAAAGAWALVRWWDDVRDFAEGRWSWARDLLPGDGVGTAVVATALALLLAALGGWSRGRGMRRWSQDDEDRWVLEGQATHPAAVSAGWSAVYGAGYLASAWATYLVADAWLDERPTWLTVTIVWAAVLGAVLCVVGPTWITWRARRRLRTSLRTMVLTRTRKQRAETDEAHLERDFVTGLERRGRLFGYLVVPADARDRISGSRMRGVLDQRPALSHRGQAHLADYRKEQERRAAASGLSPATSPPTPPRPRDRSSAGGRRRSR